MTVGPGLVLVPGPLSTGAASVVAPISSELNVADEFSTSKLPGGVTPVWSYCSIAQVGQAPIDGLGETFGLLLVSTIHSG